MKSNMLLLAVVVASGLVARAGGKGETNLAPDRYVKGFSVGDVRFQCHRPNGWKIDLSRETPQPGVECVTVRMTRGEPSAPPAFNLSFNLPKNGMPHVWRTGNSRAGYAMHWNPNIDAVPSAGTTDFRRDMPLFACYDDANRNAFTFSASESLEPVTIKAGIREENNRVYFSWHFYDMEASPRTQQTVRLRIDSRRIFWSDAVREASAWMCEAAGVAPADVPEAAYEPLYSSWYNFHQNVFADKIEQECALAAKAGMKVIILDDGWQTDDTNRGYAFCGDWQVSPRRFPDFRAHVAKVHALGMKYMVWYAVPLLGRNCANWERFKDKTLYYNGGCKAATLDPRYPEVREFLIGTYERAVREWDIDGLKLDFIDCFSVRGDDPAAKKGFKGCDYRGVPEAAARLMNDVMKRLKAIKPDILIEYRQSYVGPQIRASANMLRAADCPADAWNNRHRIANLRVSSPGTAVHADMLEWHPTEKVELAALNVLSVMFSTVQYSMRLTEIPDDHLRMIAHWSRFGHDHKDALLKGAFRAYRPDLKFPLLEGEGPSERIFGVYGNEVVTTGALDRRVYVLNGSGAESVVLEVPQPANAVVRDTFGKVVSTRKLAAGCTRVAVPIAGYVEID